jgi:hypothetical protein
LGITLCLAWRRTSPGFDIAIALFRESDRSRTWRFRRRQADQRRLVQRQSPSSIDGLSSVATRVAARGRTDELAPAALFLIVCIWQKLEDI